MSKQALPHVPDVVLARVLDVAIRLGVPIDFVTAAAVWHFCSSDADSRYLIVSDFWFRGGLGELESLLPEPHSKILKEKVYALAAYCYSVFRRRPTHKVPGR
jgi:hypothetical protein